jgi:putative hydroxymethylpyrimidine transporter CytX
MIATRAALGHRGAVLPALVNVTQLIGWTAVMLWIGGQAAAAMTSSINGFSPELWIIIAGVLTTAWALGGHHLWRHAQKIAVLLLLALSIWMSWIVLTEYHLSALPRGSFRSPRELMGWMDIVIAMPVSWMPLAADYARFGKNPARAAWGTGWGYLLAGSWMFGLGLVAALATGSQSPESVVMEVMARAGFAGAAIAIVVFSTFTTTFMDIYSTAISAQSIFPRISQRTLVALTGVLGTALALVFDPLKFEPFLLLIGSALCPLFGIVLADYFIGRRGKLDQAALYSPAGAYRYSKGFNIPALLIWAAGFAVYQTASRHAFFLGASLPALTVPAVLYLVYLKIRGAQK